MIAEQRLVYDANYWQEVGMAYDYADINLIMVGPECDPHFLAGRTKRSARLSANMVML